MVVQRILMRPLQRMYSLLHPDVTTFLPSRGEVTQSACTLFCSGKAHPGIVHTVIDQAAFLISPRHLNTHDRHMGLYNIHDLT